MSDDEKRIRIAELCGWYPTPEGHWTTNPAGRITIEYKWTSELPDYLNDLNAIHEAENARIKDSNWREYWENLEAVVSGRRLKHNIEELCIRSTARQRADAFLLTLDGSTNPKGVSSPAVSVSQPEGGER